MKKLTVVLCVVVMFMPSFLFAAPTEQEVADAMEGVVGVTVMSMMAGMFGMPASDAMSIKTEDNQSVITFKNFPAREFLDEMKTMLTEEIKCPFEVMSGKVIIYGSIMDMTGMLVDVTLTGGTVKTLWMDAADENVVVKANGKTYHNMDKFLEDE